MQILPNEMAKKLRWFRTAYLNQRFYTWIFWSSFLGFFLFYNLTTFRWLGVGSMVNNAQKEYSEIKRAAREADAIENCAEYIPGNRSYITQGNGLLDFRVLSGPELFLDLVQTGVTLSFRWYSLNNYGF